MTRQPQADDAADVTALVMADGRQLLYSTNADDEEPSDTDEWLASDTTGSGRCAGCERQRGASEGRER